VTAATQEYLDLMSGFPTGVAVVTAVDGQGGPHGLTCTSLSSVTASPPVLLTCLNIRSGTLAAVVASGAFAVNLLHAGGRDAAEAFSSAGPDRFGRTAWRPSKTLGVPVLTEDAFATAECAVERTIVAGDHVVVFGRVVRIEQADGVPLLYGRRRFSTWLTEPTLDAAPR
jgi:flavin reductase (DIM6/NTAB) family NADH-FMN oxidoreductase RutF